MGEPPAGGAQIGVGARLYTCLNGWGPGDEVRRALGAAGYDVADVAAFSVLRERVDAEDPALVVVHSEVLGGELAHAVADLKRVHPTARVVVIGAVDSPEQLLAAIAAGVAGFCPSDAGVDALLRTLDDVRSLGVAIPRSMMAPIVEQLKHGRGRLVRTAAGTVEVTEREWEILQLLLQHRSTQEMANALFVSVGTVRSHVSALLRKVGAAGRDDLIRLVERGGGPS